MSDVSRFSVKKVAVLGAGVMGAQIAAHLVNCNVPVVLFDLPAKEGDKSGIVHNAIKGLKKIKPAPLGVNADAALIEAANYDEDLEKLRECDLIIEAIAERLDWKHGLYEKIAPHIADHAILATNTSGLSIDSLNDPLPKELQERFCGIHFFNPPRYMYLVELIPTSVTKPEILNQLETFVVKALGKGVVRAKDTPNFVANRVGVANIVAAIKLADDFGLTMDVVDDLTGKRLGRASSATFRTADVVGLDTLSHTITTMRENLTPESDPFHALYQDPPMLAELLNGKALGAKSGQGFFKKVGKEIKIFDLDSGDYVQGGRKADDIIKRILKQPTAERIKALRESDHPQAQYLWALLREGFHYAAVHLADIAETARDIDLAQRWGFGMQQGVFEIWQDAGWADVAQWIKEDIDAGKTLSSAPLPDWVFKGAVADKGGVHTAEGSWSASAQAFVPERKLPVYDRQLFPDAVLGSGAASYKDAGTTVFEDEALRLWTLKGMQGAEHIDDVLIATFKTKMHSISPQLVAGLHKGLDLAEQQYKGFVIWQGDGSIPFSAGADLEALLPAYMTGGAAAIEPIEKELQDFMLRLRYAQTPSVAALRGMVLGGGCEMAVFCSKRVAAMESYVGLVEVGVGLIPGGGGLTYIARRAAEQAKFAAGFNDLLPFLMEPFKAAAMATVGTGAINSREVGYLLWSDTIVPNQNELLYVAVSEAKAMYEAGYRPPLKRPIPVAGRSAKSTIVGQLINMRDGGFISQHDFHIASLIANVVCGGDVDAGTEVTEEYLMTLERKAFTSLLDNPKTQERIMGMLQTGKPVRN